MWSLRHDRRLLVPCFSTSHSPGLQSFSPVLSTSRCTGASRLPSRHLQRRGPAAEGGVIGHREVEIKQLQNGADRIRRQGEAPPLALRLVAVKKIPQAAAAARRTARREAQRGGHQIAPTTLAAADWVILVTSLPPETFAAADILALYRLRWRIDICQA